MTITSKVGIALTLLTSLSSCAVGPGEDQWSASSSNLITEPTIPDGPTEPNGPACVLGGTVLCEQGQQGPSLTGAATDDLDAVRFSPGYRYWSGDGHPQILSLSTDDLGIDAETADGRLTSAELVGLTFSTQGGHLTRIVGVDADDATGRARYYVEYSTAGTPWSPLCLDGGFAYAVASHLGPLGTIDSAEGKMSFNCRTGAASKAIRWGYGPWDGHKDYFSAATILARADYCGNGVPHTLEGTPVLVYDLLGLAGNGIGDDHATPTTDTNTRPFLFEAAWHGEGTRLSHALCLSKLRWQTLPPGGFCNDVLPDPRIRFSGGAFCEDLGLLSTSTFPQFLSNLVTAGAHVFSSSQINDVGLWAWWTPSGGDYFATTEGFFAGDAGGTQPPLSGYTSAFVVPTTAGSNLLANVSTSPGTGKIALYVYKYGTTGERYTTGLKLAPPWIRIGGTVGYVYKYADDVPKEFTPVGLRTWIRGNDHMLVRDGVAVSPLYTQDRIEGYGFLQ